LRLAVLAGRLGDGQDVRLVEAAAQRRSTVSRGAEADPLLRISRIGLVEVGAEQPIDVDQHLAGRGFSGERVGHARML